LQINFEDCLLDTDRRELRRGNRLVAVEPQIFDVLIYLVENRERVVSKDDLFASVWGGRIVSESTLTSRINAVRKAIGDTGEKQNLIRTFAKKGFRFVAQPKPNCQDWAAKSLGGLSLGRGFLVERNPRDLVAVRTSEYAPRKHAAFSIF